MLYCQNHSQWKPKIARPPPPIGHPAQKPPTHASLEGLMEMANLDWADLFVYSDLKGSPVPETYRVRIQRDRAFWAALVPHLRDFWFNHLLPARAELAKHYELMQGPSSAAADDSGGPLAAAAPAVDGGSISPVGDAPLDVEERAVAGREVSEAEGKALKALEKRQEKERVDKLKEVVRCGALL